MSKHEMIRPTAYVLAGGRSSRFGSDKARATFEGVPLIRRVVDAFAPVVMDVTAVADCTDKYADLGLHTIADARPGLGPLGGLTTALADRLERHGPGWLLLASCDLAAPRADWVRLLATRASESGAPRIILFRGERLEPLLALYHTDLLPLAEAHLISGQRALWRLAEAAGHAELPLPGGRQGLPQINTQDDLRSLGPVEAE